MDDTPTRRRVLQGIGAAGALALAGCTGDTKKEDTDAFGSGSPATQDDGSKPSYVTMDFLEAERDLEDHRGQYVAVEGWIQYRDNEQWWEFDTEDEGGDTHTRMLETYDLFPDDPSQYDNADQELASITVVDDGSLHTALPRDAVTHREPYNVKVQGQAAVLYPDLGYGGNEDGYQFSQQHGEGVIKAHGAELLDEEA